MKRRLSVRFTVACLAWSGAAPAQEATCIPVRTEGLDTVESEAATMELCATLLRYARSVYRVELTRTADALDAVVWRLGQDGAVREYRSHVEAPSTATSAALEIANAMADDPLPVAALPPAPAPAPAPAPHPRPGAPPRQETWNFRAGGAAGASYQSVYGIPIVGWALSASLGAETRDFGVYGFAGGGRGSTRFRRGASWAMGGIAIEGIVGRLRIGVDLELARLQLESVDAQGEKDGSGPGLGLATSFDVVKLGSHAVLLQARGDGHVVGEEGIVLGASLAAGARF
jgi:hypothetical protein